MPRFQMKENNPLVVASYRIPQTHHNRLKELAEEHRVTITDVLIQMIDYCLLDEGSAREVMGGQPESGVSIELLDLSRRARKGRERLDIKTVEELAKHTGEQLLKAKHFGVTSLHEVREKLDKRCRNLLADGISPRMSSKHPEYLSYSRRLSRVLRLKSEQEREKRLKLLDLPE